MRTTKSIKAGQPGTKKWMQKYGDRLVCVRYKYDSNMNKRMITVELKEECSSWQKNAGRIPDNKIMDLRIEYREKHLRMKIKSLGGTWNQKKRVWKLPYRYIKLLNLTSRIVFDDCKG